ncbi:MAG: hypothetical protein KGR26_01835, partial [Cyanobacteria bacterium REEB65]|nr:hypothetical protein [Cyanobacteria bacterium REEB65]
PAVAAGRSPEFFSAGVLSVASPARILLQSDASSYRVSAWSDGPLPVGAVAPFGEGKIIALSDAACMSDQPEGSGQVPAWQVAGNAGFALDLIRF